MIALAAFWAWVKTALGVVGEIVRAIPWQAWALAALVAAIWWHGEAQFDRGVAAERAVWVKKEVDAKDAAEKALRKAEAAARETERRHADELDAVASKLILERAKGYEERERTIADLRAGNLRLRREWQGCEARGLPEAGAGAGGGDGDAELRRSGAADLVRIGRESDAKLAACQAVIRADREAIGVQGQ